MKKEDFIKQRKELQARKVAAVKAIDEQYTALVKQFQNEFEPIKRLKVYEYIGRGEVLKPRQKKLFTRFIVYLIEPEMLFEEPIGVTVAGWWLDEKNVPKLWKQYIVPFERETEWELSSNQTALPHPDSTKK
jgi:hypothetical protein